MNYEQQEKEFVEKSKALSFEIIRTLTQNAEKEGIEMSLKISLLALSKVAASILYHIQIQGQDDVVVDLFIGTVIESLNNLHEQGSAHEEAQDLIDKLQGKK